MKDTARMELGPVWPLLGFHLVVIACAGDTRSGEGTLGDLTTVAAATSAESAESSAGSTATSAGAMSAGSAESESTGESGELTTGNASTPGATEVSGTSASEHEGGILFDLAGGGVTSAGEGSGGCACGSTDWSYVWIANTKEGTVSKINTRTLVEEGRYITRPDKGGSPSRTSVSIDGKAVVVANRYVGLVKIWAKPEFCSGGTTSIGKNDIKAWGSDDCVQWYTDFPDATVQRPVAWTSGVLNPETCQYEHQKVWTTTGKNGNPGTCSGGVWVHRLDGDSGMIEDTIPIREEDFSCGADGNLDFGPYGGAVDRQGNFWFQNQNWRVNKFVRVDFQSLDYEVFEGRGYGITVDTKGRVWMSNQISRFDYSTMQWANANVSTLGGIAQDLQGRIWAAERNGLVWVDMETLAVGGTITLPTPSLAQNGQVKGVSVDIDGFIWAVQQDDTKAYKIDPNTFAYQFYDGLNGPYTYSDMTGGQISNVECNPPEG